MLPSKWEDENHNKHKRAKSITFQPWLWFHNSDLLFQYTHKIPFAKSASLSLSQSLSLPLSPSLSLFFSPLSLALSLLFPTNSEQAHTTHTTIGPIYHSTVTPLPKQLLWVVRGFLLSVIPTNTYCLKCMIETSEVCARARASHVKSLNY